MLFFSDIYYKLGKIELFSKKIRKRNIFTHRGCWIFSTDYKLKKLYERK